MADWRTDDRELLARILMAEAGNQGPVGMTAVGNVIMNRANTKGYGDGLRGVIMKPGQFSPMNSVTGYARGEQGQNIDSLRPDETHYMVADTLMSGNAGDLTGGATHFFNPDISNPSWAEGKDFTRIGDHVFGSADAGRGGPQATTTTQGALPMMQEEPQPQQQPQQQPQGLLGSLGIQKMQEGAAGETGQRFYERDTFKDTAATLAQAFAGLGNNPALQKAAAGIASQRTEAKARNKTVEYLRANGRGDLADMIDQGMISGKDAAGVMLAKPENTKGVAVGDRIVNPVTGEVIYGGEPTVDQDAILSARKEFTSLPVVKAFTTQTTAYGRVISSAEDPSPAGDLALIFNYMKVLDPGSTVREGEFATAQDSGSVDDRTRGLYNRIVSGERLSDQQRADFADRATRLYSGAEQQYGNISEQYSAFAAAAGLPPKQVIPNFGFSGTRYQKPLSMTPPPAPTGVNPATWPSVWAEMTDEERATYQ